MAYNYETENMVIVGVVILVVAIAVFLWGCWIIAEV